MRPDRLLLCAASLGLLSTPALSATATPNLALDAMPQRLLIAQSDEQTSISVYRSVSPAVVTISTSSGSGSGSIISPEGLVLTNNHVIRSAGGGVVSVRTTKGDRYTGQVIATDAKNDLALIRLNTTDRLPTVRLSDAENIQVGQRVFAIGSPFGLSGTLTTGILSRIGRNGDLQTDAALNPGNSGGPLLNSRGELIGVNKAILSTGGGNIGIGFATSAVVARDFIQQNRNRTTPRAVAESSSTSTSTSTSTPALGVTLDARTLVILGVQPGSVAANIGLRRGDRLIGINGRRLGSIDDLQAFLASRPATAVFTVARNRRIANVQVDF